MAKRSMIELSGKGLDILSLLYIIIVEHMNKCSYEKMKIVRKKPERDAGDFEKMRNHLYRSKKSYG